jgi:hypothetical protein
MLQLRRNQLKVTCIRTASAAAAAAVAAAAAAAVTGCEYTVQLKLQHVHPTEPQVSCSNWQASSSMAPARQGPQKQQPQQQQTL